MLSTTGSAMAGVEKANAADAAAIMTRRVRFSFVIVSSRLTKRVSLAHVKGKPCKADTNLSHSVEEERYPMRFLLVEDNLSLAAAILDRLRLDGHVVDHAENISVAEEFVVTADYDLILLDIMLPDGDGRTFLKTQRDHLSETPVIVLTARSEVSDRVGVLDLGADDYLTKPFDFAELEARCRAVLRRRGGRPSNQKRIGALIFDPLSGVLEVAGVDVPLRNKELRLLEIFLAAPDQIFSKARLVDRLFSYDEEVSENAIEVYVARLRKKISGSGVEIQTVRGLGYRMRTQ